MSAARQRPGKHARSVMSDRRWHVLGLAARAVWVELCDVADALPHIRSPARVAATVDELSRLLAADAADVTPAIDQLVQLGVLEPYRDGFRLKAY
ncbi:hypothetical protein HLH33_12995 [Gluconacetobacter diazotrophicus]|uniref:Uncharacterized protein n=1 Tax=Gluconacetobacter diazotrophicus TaxID=33996 RepID=A0A7W4I6K5_GLUDI|nr:hypothetical protein [Gluconacetobacter diazotrophicus]MBB2157216.1 hypothetical protein [Gluconacetobacter diazotrophicus]